jgi:hypothetical protein
MAGPRDDFGAVNADLEWMKRLVYQHVTEIQVHRRTLGNPENRPNMGNFNPNRLHDTDLQEIYNWIKFDLGFRVPMRGRLAKGVQEGNGVVYKLDVDNFGLEGKGIAAEEITVRVQIPNGATVINATGPNYLGVKMDEEAKAQFAEWRIDRLGPKQAQAYTITLSKAGTREDNVRGNIRWAKPTVKPGPVDQVNIGPAPL